MDDARVVAVSSGQIRLAALGDQPALPKAVLLGIAWPGGTGRLGTPVRETAGVVTRPLTVVTGTAPHAGQRVFLDRAYYLGDPRSALGFALQDVTVQGPLGPLPAWFFPGLGSTYVIGVHGQNGTRSDLLRAVDAVHPLGLPFLDITYRNDLGNARDPSGYLGYGRTEWPDLQAAVLWALDHGAEHVVLVGQSMGGAVVASFLEHSPLAEKVSRVVLDAPMLDLRSSIAHVAAQQDLPVVGGVPTPLVWSGELVAGLRYGVSWPAVDYLDDTSWLQAQTLVLHGQDDLRVPVSTSAQLAADRPDLVRVERFPVAGHVESWNADPLRYAALLQGFLAPAAT